MEDITPDYPIEESLFLIEIITSGVSYYTFWLAQIENNVMPIVDKKLLVFLSIEDAKIYASCFKFIKTEKEKKWLLTISSSPSSPHELSLFDIYSKRKYIKFIYEERAMLTIFDLISDYMFLCEDDTLYDYLIENKSIRNLKERLRDHILWGVDRDKKIYINQKRASLIKEIKEYFESKLLVYSAQE